MTRTRPLWPRRLARRFAREDGAATLEFALALPIFLMIFMASFESAVLMTRFVMLERALDMTVRELRLGMYPDPDHAQLKEVICNRTVMFRDCTDILMLELRPVSTSTWSPLDVTARCVDRAAPINVLDDLSVGLENEMMLVRACAVFDPTFPLTGIGLRLPKDETGGYALVATSAFVNEPNT